MARSDQGGFLALPTLVISLTAIVVLLALLWRRRHLITGAAAMCALGALALGLLFPVITSPGVLIALVTAVCAAMGARVQRQHADAMISGAMLGVVAALGFVGADALGEKIEGLRSLSFVYSNVAQPSKSPRIAARAGVLIARYEVRTSPLLLEDKEVEVRAVWREKASRIQPVGAFGVQRIQAGGEVLCIDLEGDVPWRCTSHTLCPHEPDDGWYIEAHGVMLAQRSETRFCSVPSPSFDSLEAITFHPPMAQGDEPLQVVIAELAPIG